MAAVLGGGGFEIVRREGRRMTPAHVHVQMMPVLGGVDAVVELDQSVQQNELRQQYSAKNASYFQCAFQHGSVCRQNGAPVKCADQKTLDIAESGASD